MRSGLIRRLGWLVPGLAGLALAIAVSALGSSPGRAAAVPLSIVVQGNHFINQAGQTVRLVGVDEPGTEYACEQGWGYTQSAEDPGDAAAIAAWRANAVRIPLNEDCWLGINQQPSYGSVAGYQQLIENYVADLNADGIYAILDLHWSAPDGIVADGQRPMPDDHSAAFWTSVAGAFKGNPAVVFDAFNEPYSPAADGFTAYPVSWSCWKSGGCSVPDAKDGDQPSAGQTYPAVGMQALVTAIRATGATQPILLGGLSYANDLSGWLANEPTDPAGQLAASFHNYQGETCAAQSCWDATIAPVAAHVPVVTGEFDEDVCNATTFDSDYMNWADAHDVSYLAWGWWLLTQQEIDDAGCSAYYLISDAGGTAASPNGTALHDHLAALSAAGELTTNPASPPATTGTTSPAPGTTTTRTTTTTSTTSGSIEREPGLRGLVTHIVRTTLVRFGLESTQRCTGTLRATTLGRSPVVLGAAHFTLRANRRATVTLKLSRSGRRRLASHRSVRTRVTITLTDSARLHRVVRRTVTLRLPSR